MRELITRVWEMLMGRWDGPLAFRLILQPVVAAVLAIRAGIRDAREGRPAYGWQVVTGRGDRGALIKEGWHHVGKLYFMAAVIDLIYQIYVYRWIYPGQTLIVAAVLAIPAYFLVRGLTDRLAQRWLSPDPAAPKAAPHPPSRSGP